MVGVVVTKSAPHSMAMALSLRLHSLYQRMNVYRMQNNNL